MVWYDHDAGDGDIGLRLAADDRDLASVERVPRQDDKASV
jgi:hypothetical protein